MSATRTLFILGALATTACVTPKQSDNDDGGDGGDGAATSIADIQQGNVAENTLVTLTEVIVTSPMTLEGDGFFIQDAGGGAWSGMYVFLQGTFDGLYLEVGDQMTITGTYTEYYDYSELTVTGMDDISITGEGEAVATDMSDMSDMEQWESVLVSLSNQTFQACPNSYGEALLESGVKVNDAFYEYEASRGSEVTEIVGLIEYSFSEFKLNPRDLNDLAGLTEGDGCSFTPQEIHDQAASDPDGLGSVELESLVVTSGLTTSGTAGFFVQAQGGGEKSGLFIYLYDDVDQGALDLAIGDVVDIVGAASVYYDMTEVSVYDDADITKTGETAAVTVDSLTEVPSDWNFWEGALVQMVGVEALSGADSYGECETDWGVYLDDAFYGYAASTGTTWDAVTGLVTYSYGNTLVLPRDEADMSGGEIVTVDATVTDVQDGTVAEGSLVTLSGVVATSGATGGGSGFFVQDAGGGAYSGVYVYLDGAKWGVQAGDVLDIVGTVTEYYDLTEIVVASETSVVVTGSATPVATVLSEAPSDWEPYEGVLLTLDGVGVTSEDDGYGQYSIDFGIFMDDLFGDFTVSNGEELTSVTGPLYYSYSEWKLCPRSDADIVR